MAQISENSGYESLIESLRKQIEIKDKEIKTLNSKKDIRKSQKKSNSFEITEDFLKGINTFTINPEENLCEFFEEIDISSRKLLINPQNPQNIRDWCLKYQDFFIDYK